MSGNEDNDDQDCVVHDHPVPPEELGRYSIERDPHSEADISRYMESQAKDEEVQHVERVKQEIAIGEPYEIWDVTTDKNRWWVITNMTNLYSQEYFPSLDYTLSFHIGLMARLRSRESLIEPSEPAPFDEVFRRMDQADKKEESAIEAEDFQAVGMLLREALITLVGGMRRRVNLPAGVEIPKDADFNGWSELLLNEVCAGSSNKSLRKHMKSWAKETWQLVNWLTHAQNADQSASSIATHSCQTVIGHFLQILQRVEAGEIRECPVCGSRNTRVHFDLSIGDDGEYFSSCAVCSWDDHPHHRD